jgi:hypothetical protein
MKEIFCLKQVCSEKMVLNEKGFFPQFFKLSSRSFSLGLENLSQHVFYFETPNDQIAIALNSLIGKIVWHKITINPMAQLYLCSQAQKI